MIPDKIYINSKLIPFYTIDKRLSAYDIEYISKDVILDIIREEKKSAMGNAYVYVETIYNRINSL